MHAWTISFDVFVISLSLSVVVPLPPSLSLPSDFVNKTALNVFLKSLDQPDVMDFTLVSTT